MGSGKKRNTGHQEDQALIQAIQELTHQCVLVKVSQDPIVCTLAFALPKRSRGIEVVLDFRKLNSCVIHERFNSLNKSTQLTSVRGFGIASSLDLKSHF